MRSPAVRRPTLVSETDSSLVAGAASGDGDAFDELYRRHAAAAWGVAQAVLRNSEDAADAVAEAFAKVFQALPGAFARSSTLPFRAYLLSATRHAAIDVLRRASRVQATADVQDTVGPLVSSPSHGPVDRALAREDQTLVTQAFAKLPERWRSALWLIEVERMSGREAGMVLGVNANNAAQLAARARARLREHYVQAHVPRRVRPDCRRSVELLGSYLAGTATRRQKSAVRDHLAVCPDCRDRVAHVEDLGVTLRGVLLPLPLLLHDKVRRGWTSVLRGATHPVPNLPAPGQALLEAGLAHVPAGAVRPLESVATFIQQLSVASPLVERVVAGAAAGALVVGGSALAWRGLDEAPPEADAPVTASAPFSSITSFTEDPEATGPAATGPAATGPGGTDPTTDATAADPAATGAGAVPEGSAAPDGAATAGAPVTMPGAGAGASDAVPQAGGTSPAVPAAAPLGAGPAVPAGTDPAAAGPSAVPQAPPVATPGNGPATPATPAKPSTPANPATPATPAKPSTPANPVPGVGATAPATPPGPPVNTPATPAVRGVGPPASVPGAAKAPPLPVR